MKYHSDWVKKQYEKQNDAADGNRRFSAYIVTTIETMLW